MERKAKEQLCNTCGERDPSNFYKNRKSTCKNCYNFNRKEYYEENKEYILDRTKNYYQNNKEFLLNKSKQYQLENIKKYSDYQKTYYIDNRDYILSHIKDYQLENKEYILNYQKQYYMDNKKDIIDRNIDYAAKRSQIDPGFKYLRRLRSRQNQVLKGNISTTEFLGCSSQELRYHFESLFQEGMTHDNHGEWHMDHKIPISIMEVDENVNPIDSLHNRKLMHYTNLQPLWKEENRAKGDKIYPELLKEFLEREI